MFIKPEYVNRQSLVYLMSEDCLPTLAAKSWLARLMAQGKIKNFGYRQMDGSEYSSSLSPNIRALTCGYVIAVAAEEPSAILDALVQELMDRFGIEHVSDIKPWKHPRGFLCTTIIVQQRSSIR